MDIAQKLKAGREKLGLSQSQAAEKWGVNVRTLQTWEQRKRTPRGLALKQLEAILERASESAGKRGRAKRK